MKWVQTQHGAECSVCGRQSIMGGWPPNPPLDLVVPDNTTPEFKSVVCIPCLAKRVPKYTYLLFEEL
jgi:hypothetical protein